MSEVADLVGQLVAIDSTNPDLVPGGAGEAQIARFIAGWLERAGLDVTLEEAAPGRPNVVATARGTGGGRALLLNGHVDTVGVSGMERPHDPYVEGNRLYGRGAADMKGSIAAMMLAMARVAGERLRGDVILAAVADEEYASIGTAAVAASVCADAAIVTEPTDLELCLAHKGFVWLDVETIGKAAHGSRPDLGVDAIVKMGRVLSGLDELDRALRAGSAHPLLGNGSIHASLISGGQELSSYPERCRLSVERRTIPGERPEDVEAQVRDILERIGAADPTFQAAITTGLARAPYEVSPGEPIVGVLRRYIASARGHEPRVVGQSGWMDAALLGAAGIPTVIFGPGGAGYHGAVEWVDLDQVALCSDILLKTARDFCT